MASYGLVEVDGNLAAVDCLNAMSRAANVRLLTWDHLLGGNRITLIVQGTAAAVKTAVYAAKRVCADNRYDLKLGGVIESPDEETERAVLESAQRLVGKS